MSLGNQIKKAEKKPKQVTLTLSVQDAKILQSIISIPRDNVGKFGLSSTDVATLYTNCITFINAIENEINK